jgi:hypothetical protein
MIIAIDFDGTCVTHEYPSIGASIGAQAVLRDLVERGHQLVLNTMRSDENLKAAVDWFAVNDIELYGVNHTPGQDTWTNSPKCYAQLYIDDAALGIPLVYMKGFRPFVDWVAVRKLLEAHPLYA